MNESVDLSAIRARWKVTPEMVERARQDHQRIAQTVALRMDQLTDSNEWNIYKAHLQAWLDRDEAAIAAFRQRMGSDDCVGEELLSTKLKLARCEGRAEGFRAALTLPQTVKELAGWQEKSSEPVSPSPSA